MYWILERCLTLMGLLVSSVLNFTLEIATSTLLSWSWRPCGLKGGYATPLFFSRTYLYKALKTQLFVLSLKKIARSFTPFSLTTVPAVVFARLSLDLKQIVWTLAIRAKPDDFDAQDRCTLVLNLADTPCKTDYYRKPKPSGKCCKKYVHYQ